MVVVFSTNLPPKDLVDEAFLRRLRHKVEITDPSYEEFAEIFKRVCEGKRVRYSQQGLAYLLQEWYIKRNRKLRAVHPRDICDQINEELQQKEKIFVLVRLLEFVREFSTRSEQEWEFINTVFESVRQ
jgi:SpoVK/Ycf46/Vps4 family AAA+-type ATPase